MTPKSRRKRQMRRKKQLLSLATIVVLILFTGFVAVSSGADVMVSPANDSLLGKYENSNRIFKRSLIGDKIVYLHQRTIKGTIVENDNILYQFDRDTGELLKKEVHWRSDLQEDLPTASITRQEAESTVTGEVQFSELIIISKNSDVFPIENPPDHACWVVRTVKDGNIIVIIIDAVTGEFLGHGVPPPKVNGFSFSGPQSFNPCQRTWAGWYENAADWFEEMGYPTEAVAWPNKEKLRSHIESTETAVFYEIAHGGSYGFSNGCIDGAWSDYTHSSDIENWIANYPKMPFTFIASCGGMCTTAPGTFSHAFRKGSEEGTATVGYCGMGASYCSSCWGGSIVWQDTFFQYMNWGFTVVEAYNEAMAMRPQCFEPQGYGSCMRHAGDAYFTLYPAVYRIPKGTDFVTINNLSVASGKQYEVVYDGLKEGSAVYIDRDYAVTGYPLSLEGAVYIQTANDDKMRTESDFLSFQVNRDVTVYLAHDTRIAAKPAWLDEFAQTDDDLVISDAVFSIFSKDFPAGLVTLGGNAGQVTSNMYVVIVVPQRRLRVTDLSVASGKYYEVVYDGIQEGSEVYIDRGYIITDYPAYLEREIYIRTANDDKTQVGSEFLSFEVDRDVTVYLAHDTRIADKPAWLDEFIQTDDDLVISDVVFSIFSKNFPAGLVTLGGNAGHNASSMYIVIVVSKRDADADGDGDVDGLELSGLIKVFGLDVNDTNFDSSYDFVFDGIIDDKDLEAWGHHFGRRDCPCKT
jgi:hypothetical protein